LKKEIILYHNTDVRLIYRCEALIFFFVPSASGLSEAHMRSNGPKSMPPPPKGFACSFLFAWGEKDKQGAWEAPIRLSPRPYAMPRGLGHRQPPPPLAFAHAPQKDAWSTGKASHCLSFIRNFFNIMRIKKRRYAQDRKPYPVPYPCATNGCLGEVFHNHRSPPPPTLYGWGGTGGLYIYIGDLGLFRPFIRWIKDRTPPCEHQWEA